MTVVFMIFFWLICCRAGFTKPRILNVTSRLSTSSSATTTSSSFSQSRKHGNIFNYCYNDLFKQNKLTFGFFIINYRFHLGMGRIIYVFYSSSDEPTTSVILLRLITPRTNFSLNYLSCSTAGCLSIPDYPVKII